MRGGREVHVGRLYDAVQEIDRVCHARGLDVVRVKGQISMECGFFLAIIFPSTPDDPEKLARLREVTTQMLDFDPGA
jgi:hypothetical protein